MGVYLYFLSIIYLFQIIYTYRFNSNILFKRDPIWHEKQVLWCVFFLSRMLVDWSLDFDQSSKNLAKSLGTQVGQPWQLDRSCGTLALFGVYSMIGMQANEGLMAVSQAVSERHHVIGVKDGFWVIIP